MLELMINSIEKRYDAENRSILRGFGYLHPKRIMTPDSFKHVKVAAITQSLASRLEGNGQEGS